MQTGKELNIINKCVLFISFFLLSSISSFAVENSLLGIDVKQVSGGEYNIMLKLDKKVNIKRLTDTDGNLSLVLNSTLPSDTMEIFYDNAADLENVIVQKKNSDNTLILFQGENIADSKVYIKELSTGLVKELDSKNTVFNSLFFISDKKVLLTSLFGVMLFFFMMLLTNPRKKRYTAETAKKYSNIKKNTNINTLRNKNLVQSKNVPSINYKMNGSFSSVKANMTKPKDFIINNQYQEIEKIRKVG